MKNVYAQIVKFNSKKDNKEYQAVQFVVHTPYGDYKSSYNFPSSLEFDIIKHTIAEQQKIDNDHLRDLGMSDEQFRDLGYEEDSGNSL